MERYSNPWTDLLSSSSSGYGYYDHNDYYPETYHGGYYYYDQCCPLVVDPLVYIALLSGIGLATYLLRELIPNSALMMARRRKRDYLIDAGN